MADWRLSPRSIKNGKDTRKFIGLPCGNAVMPPIFVNTRTRN
jgi:hypothetical protein